MNIFTKKLHVWRLDVPWYKFEKLYKGSRVPASLGKYYSCVIFGHAINYYTKGADVKDTLPK